MTQPPAVWLTAAFKLEHQHLKVIEISINPQKPIINLEP